LTWTLRAADHAAALYAAEAGDLYQDAVELATSLAAWTQAARAMNGLAELTALRGEFQQALEQYRRAGAWLESETPGEEAGVLRAAAARGQARILAQTGAPAAAAPLLEQALGWLSSQADASDASNS